MNTPADISNTILETNRLILRPWNQGDLHDLYEYASVECVIRWAFEEQKWDFLLCGHFLENDRSRRVVEKSGFRFYKEISYETQTGETKVSKLYLLEPRDI